jgi:hypothetical protein
MIDRLDNGTDLAPDAGRELKTLRLHALIDGLATHLVYERTECACQVGNFDQRPLTAFATIFQARSIFSDTN